jgi:hypothetical protein
MFTTREPQLYVPQGLSTTLLDRTQMRHLDDAEIGSGPRSGIYSDRQTFGQSLS